MERYRSHVDAGTDAHIRSKSMVAVSQSSGDYSTKGEEARNEAAKPGGLPTRTRTRASIEPSLCVLSPTSCSLLLYEPIFQAVANAGCASTRVWVPASSLSMPVILCNGTYSVPTVR
jgi:hypothetical protein